MKPIFSVKQFGRTVFYSNCYLTAKAYSHNTSNSKVVEIKMNNRLYKRAYRFLQFRKSGMDQFQCLGSLDTLLEDERELVKNFLSYKHQIKFI